MFRLMIKTHRKTGLKYLCITKRDNWNEYLGSGKRWQNHLKKHGTDISTELIYQSEDYLDFVEKCNFYSAYYDVALNEEFANVVPERGYDNYMGFNISENNLTAWWKYASEEIRKKVIESRRPLQIKNHWTKNKDLDIDEIKNKISKKSIEWWKELENSGKAEEFIRNTAIAQWGNVDIDIRRYLMKDVWEGAKKFYSDKESEKYLTWKKNVGNAIRTRIANEPFSVRSERNRKHRLELSPEKKAIRKSKFKKSTECTSYDASIAKMKIERVGTGNPAAKITYWMGVPYTSKDFKKLKLDSTYVEKMFLENPETCYRNYDLSNKKSYIIYTCPHCEKQTSGSRPSSFKRWHFDNCKEKK